MGVMERVFWAGEGRSRAGWSDTMDCLPVEVAEIACLALSICHVLELEDDEEGQLAMACAILNHMRRYGCDDGGSGGAPARARQPSHIKRLPWRAIAIACLVVSGDLEDPTDGATHFHRHSEDPEWAQAAMPKALIGGYIYYSTRA